MTKYNWPIKPIDIIQSFENHCQNPNAGALIAWAVWSVDSLHYLKDLDYNFEKFCPQITNHPPDVIDVSHARWATGTCITSLDLCAAALGRAYCNNKREKEYDLGSFDTTKHTSNEKRTEVEMRRKNLPLTIQEWLDNLLSDPNYKTIKSARDWLTHSRIKRHFQLGVAGPERLRLELPTGIMFVREIVEISCNLAKNYVTNFLQIISRH